MKGKQIFVIIILMSLFSNVALSQDYLSIAYYRGKAGFLDRSGKWYIDPVFDDVKGFNYGLAAVKLSEKWGYINTDGLNVIPALYDEAGPFENGSFAEVSSGPFSYYIDRAGKIISDSDTGIVIFRDGLALLYAGGRYGYITKDYQWQIEPVFEMAWPFKEGYARVKRDGEWMHINETGERIDFSPTLRSVIAEAGSGELAREIENGKWGFRDNSGRWIIYPRFDYVKSFSEGLAPFRIGGRWGYIDTLGNIRVAPEYEETFLFSGGLASVKIKGKFGCINSTGDLVIKAKYDNPLFFYRLDPYDEISLASLDYQFESLSSIPIPDVPEQLVRKYVPEDRRLALIIGNSNYTMGGYLANPENDARAMAETLENLGFVVHIYLNASQLTIKKAIDDFGEQLKQFDVGLFFYAGHGIQAKGYNYLIPVDASIMSEMEVEYNCVDAGRILSTMEESGCITNIIILDACRNNPFERSWTRTANGQGLAFMNAPAGSLVAYATAPGRTASDGTGNNGLYTSSLLKYINTPGLSILEVFQKVRSEVRQKSANQQIPWESTSLEGNFFFRK